MDMHSMPKSVVKVGCMWWYQRLPYVEFSSMPVKEQSSETSVSLERAVVSAALVQCEYTGASGLVYPHFNYTTVVLKAFGLRNH